MNCAPRRCRLWSLDRARAPRAHRRGALGARRQRERERRERESSVACATVFSLVRAHALLGTRARAREPLSLQQPDELSLSLGVASQILTKATKTGVDGKKSHGSPAPRFFARREAKASLFRRALSFSTHSFGYVSVPQEKGASPRQVDHIFLRGSQISFFIFPNMLKMAPMFCHVRNWRKRRGRVRRGVWRDFFLSRKVAQRSPRG